MVNLLVTGQYQLSRHGFHMSVQCLCSTTGPGWLLLFCLAGHCGHYATAASPDLRWDHLGMHFPDFINLLDGYFVRTEQKYMKPQTGQSKGIIAITSLLEERLKTLMYQLSDACLWYQQLCVSDSG